ncbi:MAG: AzlD domain-containing protein [Kiritimatiellae bacterium]|nr:AzlD domain-containing protein [Kiritimatiellia bacterium]
MGNEILYMLGVVAVGFAVNFALRALPFVLFGSSRRELPAWVGRFGDFVSPVIIAALVVYSYATLRTAAGAPCWLTPWPYLAGALTVALQLLFRNPLASIVAGTVVYMCLLNCGCRTVVNEVEYDIDHPLIRISADGSLYFKDSPVRDPNELAALLRKNNVPKDATIYILLDEGYNDQRALWVLRHNYLTRAGYPRSAWIHSRRAVSGRPEEVGRSLGGSSTPYERVPRRGTETNFRR